MPAAIQRATTLARLKVATAGYNALGGEEVRSVNALLDEVVMASDEPVMWFSKAAQAMGDVERIARIRETSRTAHQEQVAELRRLQEAGRSSHREQCPVFTLSVSSPVLVG
jgi:hypothetical protein